MGGQGGRHVLRVALISSLSVAGAVLLVLAGVLLFCRASRLRKGNQVLPAPAGPPLCFEPVTQIFADLESGTTRTSSSVEEVKPPILPEPATETFADLERGYEAPIEEGIRQSAYDVPSHDLGDGRLAATLEAHDNGNLTMSLATITEVVPTVPTLHTPDGAA